VWFDRSIETSGMSAMTPVLFCLRTRQSSGTGLSRRQTCEITVSTPTTVMNVALAIFTGVRAAEVVDGVRNAD
jgi:hypothetical protein